MAARPLTSRVEGPLAGFAAGYESWLAAKGICRRAIRDRIWQFWYPSEWLEVQGLSAGDLDRRRAEEHLAERRAAGRVERGDPSSLRWPLEYLREIGAAPPDTERPRALSIVCSWPTGIHGARAAVRGSDDHRVRACRTRVLGGPRGATRRPGPQRARCCGCERVPGARGRRLNVGGMRGLVSKLRPLLVFLHVTGRIAVARCGGRFRGSRTPTGGCSRGRSIGDGRGAGGEL